LQEFDLKSGDLRDPLKIAVEGDEFRAMMNGDLSDQQVERTHGNSLPTALAAEFRGPAPEVRRGGERRDGFEVLGEQFRLRIRRAAKQLKEDRLGDPRLGIGNASGSET
jgi:hypothetical protein